MAREHAIPSTSTFIQDFGLNVTPQPVTKNRRVVLIGTGEDGPMYEPVLVDKPDDAEIVWGRSGAGNLVRGIFECWEAQTGSPDVVGVRIGNGVSAYVDILETDSYGIHEEQPDNNGDGITSLRLDARFPGGIYNQITVRYDDKRNVAIYNPKTGLTSVFTVDINNPNNTSVDAHNVQELVDAINADPNLNSVLTASTSGVLTDYELKVRSTTPGVTPSDNGLKLDLGTLIQESEIIATENDAFLVPSPILPYNSGVVGNGKLKILTVTNNLLEIEAIESVSYSEWEQVVFEGTTGKFQYIPLDGKGTSRWDTIQCMYDYGDGENVVPGSNDLGVADSKYMHSPSGDIKSEFTYSLGNVLINEVPTDPSGKDGLNQFTIKCDLPLDETEELVNSGVSLAWLATNGTTYADYYGSIDGGTTASGYLWATNQYVETKTVNGQEVRPSGHIHVYVSEELDPNGNWVEIPYDNVSGVYMTGFTDADGVDAGTITFGIGPNAYLANTDGYATQYSGKSGTTEYIKFTNMAMLVDENNDIRQDRYIRITGNTVKGFLNEVETLPQLEANTSAQLTHYFTRGPELLTNTAPQYPINCNYGTRITYELDSNVAVSDALNGEIAFTNADLLPGPGGGPLSASKDSHIRLRYKYLPNFPAITSAAVSLKHGTNGAKLTVKQKEEEFKKVYEYLRDFEATLWVPMEAYIDDIKEDYNAITGLKEQLSSTYAQDMQDFLEELSINSIQPHAIFGVTPIVGNTLGARDAWVKNLTEIDLNDGTRAANVMINIQSKFVSVSAFEPIFLNLGRGNPYAANGQAAYAGMLASLPYDISPTNKQIANATALRKEFSMRQYEALNNMRYVSMKNRAGRPVVVNDVTAAPYGSDFISWSTYSITAEAADRVKRIADAYLGQPNSVVLRNAMDQEIAQTLNGMSGLQASNHNITSTIEQQVRGIVEIDIILVPIFTMKKIRTTVKLRKSLPTNE